MEDRFTHQQWLQRLHDDGARITPARIVTEHAELLEAAREAADFVRSYFGPVASDDPEGWSDTEARAIHGQLSAALVKAA